MRHVRGRYSLGLAVVCAVLPGAAPASGDELAEVIERHSAAVQSIRTVACRVEYVMPSQRFLGKYSRDGGRVRVSYTSDNLNGRWVEILSDGSVVTNLSAAKTGASGASIRPYTELDLSPCDAWVRGLVTLYTPGKMAFKPFPELVKIAHSVGRPFHESVDGRDLVGVELDHRFNGIGSERWVQKVYFDPSVNYLVRRMVVSGRDGKGGQYEQLYVATRFSEPAPGIFFPARIELTDPREGPKSLCSATISDINVNRHMPSETFQLKFPPGTKVVDSVQNRRYVTGPDGQPVGKVIERPLLPPPPPVSLSKGPSDAPTVEAKAAAEGRSTVRPTELKPATAAEPPASGHWVLPTSIGLLGVAGLAVVVRSFRQRRVGV